LLGGKAHEAAGQNGDEGDLDESVEVPLGPLKDEMDPGSETGSYARVLLL